MPTVCIADTMLTGGRPGGPTYFLLALSEGLRHRGWEVRVLTQRGPDSSFTDRLRGAGVSVEDAVWEPWRLPEEKAERLARWITQSNPDVFMVSNCADACWLSLPLLPVSVRTVSVAHHDVGAYCDPVEHYYGFLDAAVGVSSQIRDRMARASPPGERCRYVPYGVETAPRESLSGKAASRGIGPFHVGFVGRVANEQKRVHLLPSLVAELARRKVPFHFHVVGDGPDRGALEEAFSTRGLRARVTFSGWLQGEALRQQLLDLDILVLVSSSEGLPIAMLEAMGHGAVPVVSDVGCGMNTVIRHGENGLLLPADDMPAFAGEIEALCADPGRLHRLQVASWSSSQDYTVQRMVGEYDGLFRELMEEGVERRRPGPFPPMDSCRSPYPRWVRIAKSRVLGLTRAAAGGA